MKLISLQKFVKTVPYDTSDETSHTEEKAKQMELVESYANFLSQPLTIGMLIATDLEGNLLSEPEHYELWCKYGDFTQYGTVITPACKAYNEAKSRVLFEAVSVKIYPLGRIHIIYEDYMIDYFKEDGFSVAKKYSTSFKTISKVEDLTAINLTLTDNAKKELGL